MRDLQALDLQALDLHVLDLQAGGLTGVYGSYLVPGRGASFILVETGPASSLPRLLAGIATRGRHLEDLAAVLVTHIHLDHAGAVGALVAEWPAPVYCHPAGLSHLADPGRLVDSARRVFGDRLESLWGIPRPVPEGLLHPVKDGAAVEVAGLRLVAHHTPGHARHHIAWQLEELVFTGDVAGMRLAAGAPVWPLTPPPDIDLPAWRQSLECLRRLAPRYLAPTHFGVHRNPAAHLDELEERIGRWEDLALAAASENGGGRPAIVTLSHSLEEMERENLDRRSASLATPERDLIERYLGSSPFRSDAAGLLASIERAAGVRKGSPL